MHHTHGVMDRLSINTQCRRTEVSTSAGHMQPRQGRLISIVSRQHVGRYHAVYRLAPTDHSIPG